MKIKTEIKSNKWKIIIISTITLLVLILLLFLLVYSSTPQKNEKVNVVTTDLNISFDEIKDGEPVVADEEKELTLLDYEDLKNLIYKENKKDDALTYRPSHISEVNDVASDESKNVTEDAEEKESITKSSKDKIENETQNKPTSSKSKDSNKIIIDESSDTMKDETKHNEYKGEESPQNIEFFDTSPEKGADVKGDVPASGEHVGNWD